MSKIELYNEISENLGIDVSSLPDRLESTFLAAILAKMGGNPDELPDRLPCTFLSAIARCCGSGSSGGGDASGSGSGSGSGNIIQNVVWSDSTSTSDQASGSLVGNGIIRYVTFMNHDGTVEYGRKSVIAGEGCVDPVDSKLMDTPTRESTAQYNYTFSGGWATVPNGGKDANALKVVTEDRTVYANFIASVRYYTITFYDSDGTTVLTTKSVAYGSTPSYKPEKEGYNFVGWEPEVSAVTGDSSYIASWTNAITFANASWAKISEISQAGEAAKYFSIGDERVERINYTDVTLVIVGFNADYIKDSGVGGITIVCKNSYTTTKNAFGAARTNANGAYDYHNTDTATTVNALLSKFPSDLQAVVKEVSKTCTDTAGNQKNAYYHVWLLSAREMTSEFDFGAIFESRLKKPYEGFTKDPSLLSYDGTYWLRTINNSQYWYTVDANSVNGYLNKGTSPYGNGYYTNQNYFRFGFCV